MQPTRQEFIDEMLPIMTLVIRGMIDLPDKSSVTVCEGENTVVFEVKVDKSDLGKVIGKRGKNAEALRSILFAIASKYGCRAIMELND